MFETKTLRMILLLTSPVLLFAALGCSERHDEQAVHDDHDVHGDAEEAHEEGVVTLSEHLTASRTLGSLGRSL